MIILGVKNEIKLIETKRKLLEAGFRCSAFHEPDRNNELTAVATEPVIGDRRNFFKKYQLLNEGHILRSVGGAA